MRYGFFHPSSAQISLSINIGAQPSWGPTGYDHAEYYYLPDIQCYYYVPGHQFIYQSHGHWAFSYDLPSRYRGYDLFHSYKVVMNESQPYLHYEEHRASMIITGETPTARYLSATAVKTAIGTTGMINTKPTKNGGIMVMATGTGWRS